MEGAITSYLTCEVPEAERLSNFLKYFLFYKLVAQLVKKLPATWETGVRYLGWEDSLGEGKGYPLQYSDLENSTDCIIHELQSRI